MKLILIIILLDSNVDSDVPGTYEVTVTAVDQYGNESLVTYSVEVAEKAEEVATSS